MTSLNQSFQIHPTAEVSKDASIGIGSVIWHFSQVREFARIGRNVVLGRGVYVGKGVEIGDNSKVQNYALVYEPAVLGSGVFIGPAVVLTNDLHPRAINPDGLSKDESDWEATGVKIHQGASVGAGSVCVAPIEIGPWAMVAAGSTVVKDVPAFALVGGTPAKRIGWVGRAGVPLVHLTENQFQCPKTNECYEEVEPGKLIQK